MESIKSYTDIEQSKKLAEILPLESADMYYKAVYRLDKPEEILEYTPRPIIGSILKTIGHRNLMRSFTLETKTYKMKDIGIPCWSLAALFRLLPKSARLEKGNVTELYRVILPIELKASDWYVEPIDACVTMIEKLHELKML